jgi:hypothetical protein
MFKSGKTSLHGVKNRGRAATFKIIQSFKIGDGLSVPENRDILSEILVEMLCYRVASSNGQIVQGSDSPRDASLQKKIETMSPGRIVHGRIVYVPYGTLWHWVIKSLKSYRYRICNIPYYPWWDKSYLELKSQRSCAVIKVHGDLLALIVHQHAAQVQCRLQYAHKH